MTGRRAKANSFPREHTGHSKHLLPTTQEMTLHMVITRWSIPISDNLILIVLFNLIIYLYNSGHSIMVELYSIHTHKHTHTHTHTLLFFLEQFTHHLKSSVNPFLNSFVYPFIYSFIYLLI